MSDKPIDADCAGKLTILPGERVDELQQAGLRILQKEQGFRFGMDAVGTADAGRVFKFDSTTAQDGMEVFQIFDEDIRCLFEHIAQGRIFDVCRCQAELDIFAGFAYIFTQRGYKSGNVIIGFGFDFMNAFHRKSSLFTDFLTAHPTAFCCGPARTGCSKFVPIRAKPPLVRRLAGWYQVVMSGAPRGTISP